LNGTLTRLATLIAVLISSALVGALPAQAIVDRDCADFDSQRQAQIFFLRAGGPERDPHRLDADGDGVVCESNGGPYYYGTSVPNGGGSGSSGGTQSSIRVKQSSVALNSSTARAIAGERVRLSAQVTPRTGRTVLFQKKGSRGWTTVRRVATTNRGKAVLRFAAPARTATYRATVLEKRAGNIKYTAAASKTRRLTIQSQRLFLELSANVTVVGDMVKASGSASPVRRRRPVLLQTNDGSGWDTVDTGREDRRGRTTYWVSSDDAGSRDYRLLAQRYRGAAASISNVETLETLDQDQPPAATLTTR
jgi:hypothetical protein